MQTKKDSFYESMANIFFGFMLSWLMTYFVLHHTSDPAGAATLTVIGCTALSFARSYLIRRWFNKRGTKKTT